MTAGGTAHTVLIVDDDMDVRESLADVVSELGYRVLLARNGREALEILANAPAEELPCLILLDLNMPIMNGHEFRDRQKADPVLSEVKVVAITSDWDAQADTPLLLPKPIDFRKLDAALKQYC